MIWVCMKNIIDNVAYKCTYGTWFNLLTKHKLIVIQNTSML